MKELTTVFGQNFAQRVIFFSFLFVFSFLSFAQEGEKDNRYGGYARLHSMGDNPYIVDPDRSNTFKAQSRIFLHTQTSYGIIGFTLMQSRGWPRSVCRI